MESSGLVVVLVVGIFIAMVVGMFYCLFKWDKNNPYKNVTAKQNESPLYYEGDLAKQEERARKKPLIRVSSIILFVSLFTGVAVNGGAVIEWMLATSVWVICGEQMWELWESRKQGRVFIEALLIVIVFIIAKCVASLLHNPFGSIIVFLTVGSVLALLVNILLGLGVRTKRDN